MTDLYVVRKGGIQASVDAAIAAQKNAANGIAPLDAASKVPAANSRVESVAGRQGAIALGVADVSGAVADTDTRLSNARTPTAHKATHEPGGTDALTGLTNASIAATAAIAKTKLATLDIANADIVAGAAIGETKLALASDAAVGTPSRRTLGTGALQAAAGNDSRLRTIRDEGVALADRAILDFLGTGVIVEDDSVTGRTKVTISGAAAGAASETAAGITEQATQAEVEAGTAGNLFATVARLKAELDRRQAARRGTTRVAAHVVNGVNLATGAELTTADVRGLGTPPIPADAVGVEVILLASNSTAGALVVDSSDVTPTTFSPRIQFHAALSSTQLSVPLGTGVNAGKITLKAISAANNIFMYPVGWWR